MSDLVYILKEGASKWDDNEIRFSLRGAEKHLKFGKVFIIGYKPEFIKNIIHIPVRDRMREKHNNAMNKILTVVSDKRLSEKFILMNDDFFILKDFESIPYYHRGKIRNYLDKHQENQSAIYWQAMERTMDEIGEDALDYETHFPMVFEKEKVFELEKKYRLWNVIHFRLNRGYLLRSLYGNCHKVGGTEIKDNKFYWEERINPGVEIRDTSFFSADNKIIRTAMFQFFIKTLYPEKSKYED